MTESRLNGIATESPQPSWLDSVDEGKPLGKSSGTKYWRIKGKKSPAYLAYEALWPQLIDHLNTHSSVPLELVTCKPYMAGKSPDTAKPTLVVLCSNNEVRESISRKILDSNALQQSGFEVRNLSHPPGRKGPLRPTTSESSQLVSDLINAPESPLSSQNQDTREILSITRRLKPGVPLILNDNDAALNERYRKSTLGGAIKIRNQTLLMTAAHAFTITAERIASDSEQVPDTNDPKYVWADKCIGHLDHPALTEAGPELDYALIVMREHTTFVGGLDFTSESDAEFQFPRFTKKEEFSDWDELLAYCLTGSLLEGSEVTRNLGYLDSMPVLMRPPGASKFQEVYSIELETPLVTGTSGAWVVDEVLKQLHGHIIVGSQDDCIGYFVPAYQVFSDIERIFAAGGPLSSRVSDTGLERATDLTDPKTSKTGPENMQNHWAASFGSFIGTFEGLYVWEAVGLAQTEFQSLLPSIFREIEGSLLTPKSPLTIHVYMMGRKERPSRPTIVLCSEDESFRKGARDLIKSGDILDDYPDFSLRHRHAPFDAEKSVRL